jgi:DNA-binding beta-propeller fold protein YncE
MPLNSQEVKKMTARQKAKVRPSYLSVLLIAGMLPMVASMPALLTTLRAPADFHTSPRPIWSQSVSVFSPQPGQVAYTLALVSNTLISGNSPLTNGFDPVAVAVDSRNGYLYVADAGSNNPETRDFSRNVTVIDGATNKVVGGIGVGNSPRRRRL